MSEFTVFKLITGEQVIATLINEIEDGIVVLNPIIVKMIYILRDGEHIEQAVTSKFCQFGENNIFAFHHRNLIYRKKLDPDMVSYYVRIVKALETEDNMIEPTKEEPIVIPKDRILH